MHHAQALARQLSHDKCEPHGTSGFLCADTLCGDTGARAVAASGSPLHASTLLLPGHAQDFSLYARWTSAQEVQLPLFTRPLSSRQRVLAQDKES